MLQIHQRKKAGKREEFQILGDGEWDERYFPAGIDEEDDYNEEIVLLDCKPNATGPLHPVAFSNGNSRVGDGRNWAVDGKPDTSFNIIFDPVNLTVSCESSHDHSEPIKPNSKSYHIVGSWNYWDADIELMERKPDGPLKHQVTIREWAPLSPNKDHNTRREEFQILGDGQWDERIYPGGNDTDKPGITVLESHADPSPVLYSGSHGHGRNWAIDGKPGFTYDVTFDPENMTIKSRFHSRNIFRNEI